MENGTLFINDMLDDVTKVFGTEMFAHFANDLEMENRMIDSTIVCAHPCAAGTEKNGDQATQALGRSRGGFSTKVHVTVDGLGNPLRLSLTAGQRHDQPQAKALVAGFNFDHLFADRGYAAQEYFDWLVAKGIQPVIPPHLCSKQKCHYDKWLYCERHLVECFINKIKHYRRVFSRFDKLARRYLGFLYFVSSLMWLC